MKVLVTGSQGFIGRHVCAALRQRGHGVVGLDFAPTAEIVADITQTIPMVVGVDAIIHLAALANPRECDTNPAKAFGVNVQGTHQVLKTALQFGVKKFVFSSSAHVYDIPPRYLPTDECHPLRLNNTYTTTKLLGEQLCHLFYENHGLSYTTLRLYNAYGPGQVCGYFIPDILARARDGPVDLQGGNTTKDWVFVADVAMAFVRAVETPYVGAVNIGTGIETPLRDIADVIAAAAGTTVSGWGTSGATRMRADRQRAKQVLGWEPQLTLQEGLNATIAAAYQTVPV